LPALLFACILLELCACAKIVPAEDTTSENTTVYEIAAELFPETHSLNVTATIRYTLPQDELAAVKLRLYANAYQGTPVAAGKYSAAYPNGVDHGGCEILSVEGSEEIPSYEVGAEDPTVLTIRLAEKHKKGDEISLTIRAAVTLANTKHRLGYTNGYYVLSDFYPVMCPYEDGKFRTDPYYPYGDPFLRETSDFDVTLTLPITMESAASALPTEVRDEGLKVVRRYVAVKTREFACVASPRLLCKECRSGDLTLRYYYEKDNKSADTLGYIEEAVRTFEDAFGEHPYPSFSIVLAPFFEAGMEFSGLALINNALSATERKKTILHETAHEWWHGKVGSDEISHPWQDEALAEYSVWYYHKVHQADGYCRRLVNDALDDYTTYAALKGDAAVSHPLSLGEEGYVETTYRKGLLMMTSLAEIVGADKVARALKQYADDYRDTIAPPKALIDALSKLSEENYFHTWLYTPLPLG